MSLSLSLSLVLFETTPAFQEHIDGILEQHIGPGKSNATLHFHLLVYSQKCHPLVIPYNMFSLLGHQSSETMDFRRCWAPEFGNWPRRPCVVSAWLSQRLALLEPLRIATTLPTQRATSFAAG